MPDRKPWDEAPPPSYWTWTDDLQEPPAGPGSASEPLPEWHCPSCGHTTRARMADRDVPTPAEVAEEIAREIEADPCDVDGGTRAHDVAIAREVGARYARNDEQPRHPDGQRGEEG